MATKKPNWKSKDLADSDFVQLSKGYFDLQTWDLHTAICLWAKVNPKDKGPLKPMTISDVGSSEDEVLDRYLKVTLDAIQCSDSEIAEDFGIIRLPVLSCPSHLVSAKEVLLNPRHFIAWVEKKYEGREPHLTMAEAEYQARKHANKIEKQTWGNFKKNSSQYADFAKSEFFAMVEEKGIDLSKAGIILPLAKQLHERLCEGITNPYKVNTLRSGSMIPSWINEYLSKH